MPMKLSDRSWYLALNLVDHYENHISSKLLRGRCSQPSGGLPRALEGAGLLPVVRSELSKRRAGLQVRYVCS